jgi:chaperone modulatory protein CbpM
MRLDMVLALFPDLDAVELEGWIEQRWVRPETGENDTWIFQEIDVARIRLIYDLRRAFETPEATIELVLSLVDQVYELRRALKVIDQALVDQPPAVRDAVRDALRAGGHNS